MKKLIYTFIALSLTTSIAYAQQKQSRLSIQPVVGYSRANGQTMFIYGGRLLYGPKLYSLEIEVTNGKNTYDNSSQNLRTEETNLTGMVGVRSELSFFKGRFGLYGRAGAHGRKRDLEYNQNGVITTDKQSYVSPYAGGGLSLRAFNLVSLNAGLTVIFTGRPESSDREYQTTVGMTFHF